jgi:hypothetical protein
VLIIVTRHGLEGKVEPNLTFFLLPKWIPAKAGRRKKGGIPLSEIPLLDLYHPFMSSNGFG